MPLRIAAELARANETSFGGPWNADIARQTERRPGRLVRIGVLDPVGTHDPLASSKNAQPGCHPNPQRPAHRREAPTKAPGRRVPTRPPGSCRSTRYLSDTRPALWPGLP